VIDLRSDTVTKPSAGMRAAMAAAEVGDDVFGEDPTVARLEGRAAELLGKEAAVFVPSGTMANQIALKLHCQPGDEVVVGEGAHVYLYESGAGAAIAGVQFAVVGQGGLFSAADVEAVCKPPSNPHNAPTRLVCLENSHNRGGGIVWTPAQIAAIAGVAAARGLALHLDGARVLNAAAALGTRAAALAAPFATASLCFSKGLGAPVGSVLAGSRALIARARRFRKMLGGGMRQVGILAAAAEYALAHNVERLHDDHANARLIAERTASIAGVTVDLGSVVTNIVMIDLGPRIAATEMVLTALGAEGLLCLALGPRRLRLVTHLDVSRSDCERAAAILERVLGRLRS
jgi:threonine aldolase